MKKNYWLLFGLVFSSCLLPTFLLLKSGEEIEKQDCPAPQFPESESPVQHTTSSSRTDVLKVFRWNESHLKITSVPFLPHVPKYKKLNESAPLILDLEPLPRSPWGNWTTPSYFPTRDAVIKRCKRYGPGYQVDLGTMKRSQEMLGEIEFEKEPVEELHIFYRFCPRTHKMVPNGPVVSVISITSLFNAMLVLSPSQRKSTVFHLYMSGFEEPLYQEWITFLRTSFNSVQGLNEITLITHKSPNNALDAAKDALNGIMHVKNPRAICLFFEDDYSYHPEMLQNIVEVESSHDICLIVPHDYFDRYIVGDDMWATENIILAGRSRHWRTVESFTGTFGGRAEVFHAIKHIYGSLFGEDRQPAHAIGQLGIRIFSPIPSLATHTQSLHFVPWYQAPYFDYFRFYLNLVEQARLMGTPLPGGIPSYDEAHKHLTKLINLRDTQKT